MDDVSCVAQVRPAVSHVVAVGAEEVDVPFRQVPQGAVPAATVEKETGVYLDEHAPALRAGDESLVMQETHVAVDMGDDGDAAQRLAAKLNFIQHGVGPGQHGRLDEEERRALQAEVAELFRHTHAREVEHLGPEADLGKGLAAGLLHGAAQVSAGLLAPGKEGGRVVLIGVEVRGGTDEVHALAGALPQHGKAGFEGVGPVVHAR